MTFEDYAQQQKAAAFNMNEFLKQIQGTGGSM